MSAARANLARGGCAAVSFFSVDFGSLSKMASRLRCGGFFRVFRFFFVDPVFANLKWSSSHPPLFLLGFLGMGVTPHCTCVFGQLAFNPSYYFFVFWGLLTKALFFSLKKGYFGSFLSASLSFSLVFFTSLCHTLSLSLFLSLFLSPSSFLFFVLPCCLVFIFTFLVFCCFFFVLLSFAFVS